MQALGGDQVKDEHAAHIAQGNGGADGLGDDQIDKAQQDGQGAGLAQDAAVDAHEQVEQVQAAGVSHLQGGGAGQLVHRRVGVDPGVHLGGKADEQDDAAHQGGVGKVHADAAEQLLGDDDGRHAAHRYLAQRHPDGDVHGQDDAGDHGGQVADGVGPFEQLAVQPLQRHADHHREGGDQQRAHPEDDRRSHHAGAQSHDDVGHQAPGRLIRADMGGGRNNKLCIHFYLLPPFLISFR